MHWSIFLSSSTVLFPNVEGFYFKVMVRCLLKEYCTLFLMNPNGLLQKVMLRYHSFLRMHHCFKGVLHPLKDFFLKEIRAQNSCGSIEEAFYCKEIVHFSKECPHLMQYVQCSYSFKRVLHPFKCFR